MSPTFRTEATSAARIDADLLVLPVYQGRLPGPGIAEVDAALGFSLEAFMVEAAFEGKSDEVLSVPTSGRLGARALVLIGLGDPDKFTLGQLRRAAATAARRSTKAGSMATTLVDAAPAEVDRAQSARCVVEGIALGGYQFLNYRSKPEPSRLSEVTLVGKGGARMASSIDLAVAVCEAVAWARDLINEPSGTKGPVEIAAKARKLLRNSGVRLTVLDEAAIARERLGGVLGVAKGSERPPRFLKMEWVPKGKSIGTVALIGKGVTFDSGGISLKPAEGMEMMKTDMSGGAAVIAAMSVLGAANVKVTVRGYVPLVENMPSGSAYRPGDVLVHRNGKTSEVLNTDAEGRLILADALALAAEESPDAMVDLATLTGACMVALGEKIAGLMGNTDDWCNQVKAAGDRAGEPLWPMPLPAEYAKQLESEVADLKNIGSRYGGSLTAGLFLKEFVGEVPWVHLDIAGPARASADDGELVRGGTGFGVRTIVELLRDFKKPAK